MAKSANTKLVLCFKEGEPYLYDKEKKNYIAFCFVKERIVKEMKKNILEKNYKKRPSMKDIWQLLALTIPHCDAFCNSFSIRTTAPERNSFENFFSREISDFLNELFPLKDINEFNKLRKEYEKKYFKRLNTSETAQKNEKNLLMAVKKGRKLYY